MSLQLVTGLCRWRQQVPNLVSEILSHLLNSFLFLLY